MEKLRARPVLPGVLLLLGVAALLLSPCGSQTRPNWRSGPAQVVIPRKAPSEGGAFAVSRGLSYSLRLEGRTHIIRLERKKLLVSRHLPVFTYTEQRALHEDQPFVQDDCYHHGYVEGIPESLVVLSTCLGAFRGIVQINDLTYEIEPIRHSTTFEHQLYKIDSKETQFPPMKCGLTEEEIQRQKLEFQVENSKLQRSSTEGWWTHWPFVELVVVMDNYSFNYSNRNVSKATEDILNVINLVDSIYLQLGLHVSLIGIEIWNQGNLINVEQDISELLDSFSQWKSVHLYPRLPHDSGHLFVGKDFSNIFGLAWISGICYPQFGTAVCKFLKEDFFHFAVVIAHQLGHNLGMSHTEEFCFCRKKHCIMNAYNTNTNVFSNCSYGSYFNLTNQRGVCLKNTPTSRNIAPIGQCGNKVIEGEEECDCGSERQCRKDPCCGSDCKLRPWADCAFGLCCIKSSYVFIKVLCF
ncbi:disintegrin and metalloproteinase domain-containing protein 21-like [Dasypus novemcinctus]|uniref:disintegrin and metalloproteinase domain-containing protein 21-like n=1 Tax=Dasypus novemcinctus TaxID=9361 RepID=UPI00265DBFCF|nr:disintegrin and metalloproteinase domain-containing protein 21-like [Dasypus novemcinctus]